MRLGIMLYICALILLPFSSLDPLLKRLRIRRLAAATILLAGIAVSPLSPIRITEEISVSVTLLYIILLAVILLCAMRRRLTALFSAMMGGALAFAADMLLPEFAFEPGVIPGIFAAIGSIVFGKILKPRLFGALMAPIFAEMGHAALAFSSFGYMGPIIGGSAFSDVAAVSLFTACAVACALGRSPRRAFGS